jgi:hypothetical protein
MQHRSSSNSRDGHSSPHDTREGSSQKRIHAASITGTPFPASRPPFLLGGNLCPSWQIRICKPDSASFKMKPFFDLNITKKIGRMSWQIWISISTFAKFILPPESGLNVKQLRRINKKITRMLSLTFKQNLKAFSEFKQTFGIYSAWKA